MITYIISRFLARSVPDSAFLYQRHRCIGLILQPEKLQCGPSRVPESYRYSMTDRVANTVVARVAQGQIDGNAKGHIVVAVL